MQISGNTILITGGTSGIGRVLAEAFHAEDNQVIITGRRQHLLDEIAAMNPGIQFATLDVEDNNAIMNVVEQLKIYHPDLNVVIHNAGIMRAETVQDGKVDDAEATVATNLLAPIRLTTVLLPLLVKQPQASDPNAMPLEDFICETMHLLRTSPDATEICVGRVKPLRFAEANGSYDAFFKKFNHERVAATSSPSKQLE